MTKILCSADWHILLHKKKVPYTWQMGRFKSMFAKLLELEHDCDVHIIAGDIFDKKPEPDEICLFLSYINSVTIPTYIIPGNHEATRKGESFFEHFTERNDIKNENVHVFTKNGRATVGKTSFCFFPYGEMQINNLPEYIKTLTHWHRLAAYGLEADMLYCISKDTAPSLPIYKDGALVNGL